jgi:hypothetical protein
LSRKRKEKEQKKRTGEEIENRGRRESGIRKNTGDSASLLSEKDDTIADT